ncbi:MAG: single-stranded-DNA-specific exonuclease RecJ, partial [Planctomycetota bacterium]
MAQGRIKRKWMIATPHPDAEQLAREARIPPLVAQLLLTRGVSTPADAKRFLNPNLKELLPPDALPNAVAAAERLARAVADHRRIVIYGDYDVDGVTATTILWHALRLAGADVDYYIPRRLDEGYGVNVEAIESLARSGAGLIITVDCGVTAIECARRARELGVELIVTDHHEPRRELPDALLVHPTAGGADSPN